MAAAPRVSADGRGCGAGLGAERRGGNRMVYVST